MIIKEFRIPLPLTLREYQVAQLFSVAELSKMETGGGEGVEFLTNEDFKGSPLFDNRFDSGIHTYKVYHLANRMPSFIRLLIDKNMMDIHEEAWNAFPYCRTVITNPGYMKEKFSVVIETMHHTDRGGQENIHLLPPEELKKRTVVHIDIGNDPFTKNDYRAEIDPSIFVSQKTRRGPLKDDWIRTSDPMMTCYKLVKAEFKWFGLQKRVENFIVDTEQKLFLRFHRQLFCWIDRWYDLNMDDIRKLENQTQGELHEQIRRGGLREGTLYRHSSE